MMQRWGADAIRFMKDASEYGSYYEELTKELLSYLPTDGHICDAGCGLGYLANEVAKYCREVTALDVSEAAINSLKNRITRQNLFARCEDIFEITDRFDAMIFCYFGKTNEILSLAKKLCKGNAIVIKRDCAEHLFSIGEVKRKKHSVEGIADALEELKIPFEQKQLSIEMGQPFHTFDDAMSFFELYNKSDQLLDAESVKQRLVNTEDPSFPLYLPSIRKMELIVFSANDL